LPVLAAIKKAKPEARVDWLVEENYSRDSRARSGPQPPRDRAREVARETPEAIAFTGGGGYLRAARYLRAQHYDVALDLQGLLKSAVWARASGARRVVGFDRAHLREELAASFYSEERGARRQRPRDAEEPVDSVRAADRTARSGIAAATDRDA
jgi:heptosyltransferase-1